MFQGRARDWARFGRPHAALVKVRLVAEAERRVPRVELLRALEETDDLARILFHYAEQELGLHFQTQQ